MIETERTREAIAELERCMEAALAEWRRHEGEIARIDDELAKARKKQAAAARKRPRAHENGEAEADGEAASPRKRYERTGRQSLLWLIRTRGVVTTAEANDHWQREGRAGRADPDLLALVRDGVLRRERRKRGAGSVFSLIGR